MNEILELFKIPAGIVAAIGAIFVTLAKIHSFRHNRDRIQISKIQEALESGFFKEESLSKRYLELQIEQEYFFLSTGTMFKKKLRDEILNICNDSNGLIEFSHFKTASPFISYKDNKLTIKKPSFFNKFEYYYQLIFGPFLAIIGLLFIVLSIVINYASIYDLSYNIIFGLILIIGGIYVSFLNIPYTTAVYINKYLS